MSDAVHDLKMPSFGADMAKGTLVEWLVKQGDKVKRGSVIAVIETHKGAIDLDLFEDAIIDKLLLKEGQQVTVGTPIARLRTVESTVKSEEKTSISEAPPSPTINVIEPPASEQMPVNNDFILATPAARALAIKKQLSLTELSASNNQQALTEAMVAMACADINSEATATQKHTERKNSSFDKQAMRDAISATVTRSKQQIPHYYLSQRIDITLLEDYLQEYNSNIATAQRLLLSAPLLCAIARTLMKNQQLNGIYADQQFVPSETVNLANAINLRGGGLVMPVIHEAQQLTAPLMMQQLKEQVARARSASLRISEINGGSCTVTSIGERGAEQMFAVIYPPQVAIIALGSAHKEPLVVDDNIQIRTVIDASLAADHRVSDGQVGARFLYQLNQLLQQPEQLWASFIPTN